ncbi:MAG TPA: peptidylprolyl isomerase [Terriglobia bacterium]|nr:peptidylprolyl isomerase [Terriglobia bacterium]
MRIRRHQTAIMIPGAILAGALGALVCVAQTSPAPNPAAKPSAQSATPPEAASPDKVVLKVGETKVTKADVDFLIGNLNPQVQQAVTTQGRKPVGDEYAMMVLLSQKAQDQHLDAAPDIQRKIAFQKLQILAQEEYQKIARAIQINPDEINTYYTAHKGDFPEEAEIHEFVVTKKPADAKPGDPGLSAEEAKTRLTEIQKAVEAGTNMEDIAKKYDVPNTVLVDPKPVTVRKGQMIPALDKAAFDLQPNQFSAPLETPRAMVMLQMLSRHQPDLKTVTPQIEDNLRQEKVRATMDDLKAKANIWMDPDYFKEAPPSSSTPEQPKAPPQP